MPYLWSHLQNSFEERFEIAQDEDRCKELLVELTRELTEIGSLITKTNKAYTNNNEEIIKIETILEKKRGEVKLRDIIETEGKRELKKVFDENINNLKDEIFEISYQNNQFKLNTIENKERKKDITNFYQECI
ncbi:MAG: hypothetical protein ACEPOZ_21345 [Marinifilaceae bacterium]